MGRVSWSSGGRRRNLDYTLGGKLWLLMKKERAVRSRLMRRRFRDQKDFGVALCFNVVVHAVGAIGFGDHDIHELRGLLGGTHDETGFQGDIGDDFAGAICSTHGA